MILHSIVDGLHATELHSRTWLKRYLFFYYKTRHFLATLLCLEENLGSPSLGQRPSLSEGGFLKAPQQPAPSAPAASPFLSSSVAVRLDGMRDVGAAGQSPAHSSDFLLCPDWRALRLYRAPYFIAQMGDSGPLLEETAPAQSHTHSPDSQPSALSLG